MAMELRQQLKLTQQLVMTPQLQMAIRLLQLSRLELLSTIQQELEENPALVEEQENQESGTDNSEDMEPTLQEIPAEKEVTIEENVLDQVDWNNYIDEYNTPGKVLYESEEKDTPKYEAFIAQKESLSDHLLWQFMMTSPDSEEKEIGSYIIGNLSRSGYLEATVDELCEISGSSEEKVREVIERMQKLDPPGVCAADLPQCLRIQAKRLGCDSPLVSEIINNHLNHLENKNYKAICRRTKASMSDVVEAANIIKSLDPRPGLRFSDENPQYISPDIFVYKIDEEFVILLNDDGLPKLRLNAMYQKFVGNKTAEDNTKSYMQEKLRSAAWLIKSIHQRQKTIYRVMESILKFQRDFFEKGIQYLKPMVLRDVAEDIDMHESTISRVTTNKYAFTPQGLFELKYFFNSSINRTDGDAMASASVQQMIRKIIENENPKKPYSDDKIASILKESNIKIARRTVAKYREIMRILPSNKRKQI